ncbi:MAG: YggS family pyridoxal phosphate-dependent enzyme [Candidatus Cyclonatronum sp.]|uniref:YggS family pyridoxal phosphate-dependent enzyme n=1 Tax=Cyclonatronum sp. TaxID=3024185 RepID=UPI0025C20D45|nr:YggS family pyridoxal phosphate-dependent enzyme [Cyclonatronum sp.]MCC5935034.1 YggS family pyridoxal phosphate-dependent enzyme [Balneolales bacterium]MCH8487295.1 YggS family pyridoxal phosphate-dependent enzyme [Cyclonatronum sp.]
MAFEYYHQNLQEVKERIARACVSCNRNPDEITLIAVSKTNPVEAIQAMRALGPLHFGENKVQELVPKMKALDEDKQINWHMIGTLQTNKIKYLADRVDWIHSVPKLKALKEIDKRAEQAGRVIKVLIQVNISEEDQKSGCDPAELPGLLLKADEMQHITVMGLMGMATFSDDPELVRPEFRLLRELLELEQKRGYKSHQLTHLSMGMTNDLEVAVQEGATMLRIGTALFGKRAVDF